MQQMFGADSIKVVKGSNRLIKLLIRYRNGEAFDMTGVVEVLARFQSKPPTIITMTANEIDILEPKPRGTVVLKLDTVKSAKLDAGDRKSFDLEITKNSKKFIVQFLEVLDVDAQIT